jgi:hypothetical protein
MLSSSSTLSVAGSTSWRSLSSASSSAYLAEKRRAVIGDETVDAALAGLSGPLDHARVIDWIADFYRRSS